MKIHPENAPLFYAFQSFSSFGEHQLMKGNLQSDGHRDDLTSHQDSRAPDDAYNRRTLHREADRKQRARGDL